MNKIMPAVSTAAIVLLAAFGAKIYFERKIEKAVNNTIGNLSTLADIDYKNIHFNIFDMSIHIEDIAISISSLKQKINIHDLVIFDMDRENEIPTYLHASLNGVDIHLDNSTNKLAKLYQELGYTNPKMNMVIDYKYDKTQKELTLNKLMYSGDNLFDLDTSFHLSNIDIGSDNNSNLQSYMGILLHEAKIKYRDASLFSRFLELNAKNNQTNVNDYTDKLTSNIDNEIGSASGDFERNALNSVKYFIINKGSISLSISPNKPVPFGRIQRLSSPEDIITLLNMNVVADVNPLKSIQSKIVEYKNTDDTHIKPDHAIRDSSSTKQLITQSDNDSHVNGENTTIPPPTATDVHAEEPMPPTAQIPTHDKVEIENQMIPTIPLPNYTKNKNVTIYTKCYIDNEEIGQVHTEEKNKKWYIASGAPGIESDKKWFGKVINSETKDFNNSRWLTMNINIKSRIINGIKRPTDEIVGVSCNLRSL